MLPREGAESLRARTSKRSGDENSASGVGMRGSSRAYACMLLKSPGATPSRRPCRTRRRGRSARRRRRTRSRRRCGRPATVKPTEGEGAAAPNSIACPSRLHGCRRPFPRSINGARALDRDGVGCGAGFSSEAVCTVDRSCTWLELSAPPCATPGEVDHIVLGDSLPVERRGFRREGLRPGRLLAGHRGLRL